MQFIQCYCVHDIEQKISKSVRQCSEVNKKSKTAGEIRTGIDRTCLPVH